MTFKELLKDKRLEWGLTQKQMAKKLDIPLSTYKYLEIYGGFRGSYPSPTTIQKLRKKNVFDYTYKEIIQIIDLERKKERRKHNK